MFRWKTASAALAIAALALTGCSGQNPESSSSSGSTGGTLTLANTLAPTTLDAAGSGWAVISPYYQAAYDTLLRITTDGKIEPFLAEKWSYNADATALTLNLRNDVTFSDGSKLTSAVVKINLERFQKGTSPDASFLKRIQSIETPDDRTVVLRLSSPDPAMLNYLARDPGLIASGDAISKDPQSLATNPIGSGPYILDTKETVIGTSYVYAKNSTYWNPSVQHYDKLVIKVMADATAALNAIKSGEVNGVRLLNNNNLEEVKGAGWTVNQNEMNVFGMLLLDRAGTSNKALGDVRVRQAINHAFDRKALLKALQFNNGTVTEQVFPKRSAAFDADLDNRYSFDPQKARQLLAEAGYPDGFTLTIPTTASVGATTWTLIGQQLADVGIKVEFTDAASNFVSDILAPKHPAAWIGLEQQSDWQLIQFMISPTAVWNPFKYADAKVDELVKQVQVGDESARQTAAKDLNKYIVEQAWFAPWYRPNNSFATDAGTSVKMLSSNVFPAIYDFEPKQ
ncbi:ABC transporter substrate-binding protein [Pseudarthrobacter sp. MDT3-1]